MAVERPLAYVCGNLLFGRSLADPWALFRLPTHSYAQLPRGRRIQRFLALLGALQSVEADFQLLRIARAERPAPVLGAMARELGGGHPAAGLSYLRGQARLAAGLCSFTPRVYLAVRLQDPQRDLGDALSQLIGSLGSEPQALHPRRLLARVRAALAPSLLPARELERLRRSAEAVHDRLVAYLPAVRPAGAGEVQWLVRRAFCRGLGEPGVELAQRPAAVLCQVNGEAMLVPLEGQLVRWSNALLRVGADHLELVSELGVNFQALLAVGALPEQAAFPSGRLELAFGVSEAVDFPVDLAICARFIPNRLALKLARRGIQDADQLLKAEQEGEQGASDRGFLRSEDARELLSYLQSPSHPPLLRATISLAVGAADRGELERRVDRLRRGFGEVKLHRPLGDQLALFKSHLPGRPTLARGYDDVLTCEQVAALMPTATQRAGCRRGFYLGHILCGPRRPVYFDLREGSRSDRNTAILCFGSLGSGKTTLVQKLLYEAFLLGARIVDCDPKGDHRLHQLAEVSPHVEQIELRPDPALRGLLDPLRVAPPQLRQEAAVAFLRDLLPANAPPGWEAALLRAVGAVMRRGNRPSCGAVVRALGEGDREEAELAQTLTVFAEGGLTQLAFAPEQGSVRPAARKQLTYLSIRDLPAGEPGVARSERTQAERVGQQLMRLIAMLALSLLRAEPQRLKVFAFDEGWRLLGDPVGRSLLLSLERMGRSELAVPIISTQLLTDAMLGERESLAGLVGATFVFGLRAEEEVARALALLGVEARGDGLAEALLAFDAGRCLFRDHAGRVEPVQVELGQRLLSALSTTPAVGVG